MKKNISNILTCCNLLSGSIAVLMAVLGEFNYAFGFICLGALFDFSDGFVARLVGIASPIGKELDSLSDVITFGLVPAMMVFRFLNVVIGWWALLALLMVAFSAVRLAKFNLDSRQTSSFIGLATPPNAIFWASLTCMPVVLIQQTPYIAWIILVLCGVSCYLLVSEIPFFSFKNHGTITPQTKRRNYVFFIGVILIIVLCVFFAIKHQRLGYALFAGAECVIWYVIVNFLTLSKTRKKV